MYAHQTQIIWNGNTTIAALFLLATLIALYVITRPQSGRTK